MSTTLPSSLRTLSLLAQMEAPALVALVGVAMPHKYLAGVPDAVRWVGMTHGRLCLLATATLFMVLSHGHLPADKDASVFAASLIPFAGLWTHRMLVQHMAARTQTRPGD